jgi:hypothetical protein
MAESPEIASRPSLPVPFVPTDGAAARVLAEEIRVGLDRMRHMGHDQLRSLISTRVEMLESVLKERTDRREALETARLAARLLEIRRSRARIIKRRVDRWSGIAAAACFAIILSYV